MIILGVDPGTVKIGYGIIKVVQGKSEVLGYNAINLNKSDPLSQRLKLMFRAISEVMDEYKPDVLSIETAFYGVNAQTALKLGHARGVIILAAVERDIPIAEYSPREIKRALVGNGNASKQQVQYMIKTLLTLKTAPVGFDTTDALAVAMCHIHRSQKPAQRFTSWKDFVTAHPEKIKERKKV